MNATSSFSLITGIIAAAALLASPCCGQDASPGFFRLVIATGIDGEVEFDLDNEKLSEDGYASGESTGSIGFLPKTYRLTAKHSKWADATLSLELKSGDRLAIIVYSVPVLDKEGREKKRTINFATLTCNPQQRTRSAALLSVSAQAETNVAVGDAAVVLKPLNQQGTILNPKGGFVGITLAGVNAGSLNTEDPGDYGVVIFDKADGSKGCITFCEVAH